MGTVELGRYRSVGQPSGVRALGMCVQLASGSTADGTDLVLAACDGGAEQRFVLNSSHDLVSALADKCADVRDKQTANLKAAREGFADRLGKALTEVPKELAPWVKIEKLYLDTVLARDPARVAAECWEIVGSEPPKPVDADAEAPAMGHLDAIRKDRAFTTLCYLATVPDPSSKV